MRVLSFFRLRWKWHCAKSSKKDCWKISRLQRQSAGSNFLIQKKNYSQLSIALNNTFSSRTFEWISNGGKYLIENWLNEKLNVMETRTLITILLISLIDVTSTDENALQVESNEKILSRRKRYLIFPTGSSFSVAVCMTVGIYGNPQFSFIR